MKHLFFIFILLSINLLLAFSATAQNERRHIRESFKLYNDSDYVGAQNASVKALAEAPNSFEAAYNYCLLYTSPSPRDRG